MSTDNANKHGIQKRYAISDRQKQALRRAKVANPSWTQQNLRQWFQHEYGRSIAQSSVAEILSNRYDRLDSQSFSWRVQVLTYRERKAGYPALEKALAEYIDQLNLKKMNVNGDIIMEAAHRLWCLMPDYHDIPEPKWSAGWLGLFKKRFKIKSRTLHGESASVNIEEAQERLRQVQDIVKEYETRDIFNCDETGLFWKMTPRKTLSRFSRKGTKEDKARITAHFTTNASGTERLFPWIIGNAKNPRCFGKNGRNIQGMPLMYHSNKRAWMTGEIFAQYLQWFDSQFSGRKVLLLCDNFSAHEVAISALKREGKTLQHTRVEFLLKNATSLYQPLDQGIIQNTKVFYRRHWIRYILDLTMQEKDPTAEVNLLNALWWLTEAWQKEIKPQTIANCWRKSQVFGKPCGPIPKSEDWDNAMKDIMQTVEALKINNTPEELTRFIDPEEEQVEDTDEDQLAHLATLYSEADLSPEGQHDSDNDVETVQVATREAVDALERFILYEKQQPNLCFDWVLTLEKRLRKLRNQLNEEKMQQRQSNLDSWLALR